MCIIGLRDRLAHAYFAVDHHVIWDVVVARLPQLHAEAARILGTV